jgi:hypothetical protein
MQNGISRDFQVTFRKRAKPLVSSGYTLSPHSSQFLSFTAFTPHRYAKSSELLALY